MRWCLDQRHSRRRSELGLEGFEVQDPGGESQEISHLENWRIWTLKMARGVNGGRGGEGLCGGGSFTGDAPFAAWVKQGGQEISGAGTGSCLSKAPEAETCLEGLGTERRGRQEGQGMGRCWGGKQGPGRTAWTGGGREARVPSGL